MQEAAIEVSGRGEEPLSLTTRETITINNAIRKIYNKKLRLENTQVFPPGQLQQQQEKNRVGLGKNLISRVSMPTRIGVPQTFPKTLVSLVGNPEEERRFH